MASPTVRKMTNIVGALPIGSTSVSVTDSTELDLNASLDFGAYNGNAVAVGDIIQLVNPADPGGVRNRFRVDVITPGGVGAPDIITFDTTGPTLTSTSVVYPDGSIVERLSAKQNNAAWTAQADAIVEPGTLIEGLHYQFNHGSGLVRFTDAFIATGSLWSVLFDYKSASGREVNLGKRQPNLEFQVRLEHYFPGVGASGNRKLITTLHKCEVTPENPNMDFNADDWIAPEFTIACLESSDPAHVNNPFGKVFVENNPVNLLPYSQYNTENYSVGVFDMFLTPLSAATAIARNLPQTGFYVGNVVTGGIEAVNEFLDHFRGVPKKRDKRILIQQEFNVNATIDELTAVNLAILFNGDITDLSSLTPVNAQGTVTVPPDQFVPGDYVYVWVPLGYIFINPS